MQKAYTKIAERVKRSMLVHPRSAAAGLHLRLLAHLLWRLHGLPLLIPRLPLLPAPPRLLWLLISHVPARIGRSCRNLLPAVHRLLAVAALRAIIHLRSALPPLLHR